MMPTWCSSVGIKLASTFLQLGHQSCSKRCLGIIFLMPWHQTLMLWHFLASKVMPTSPLVKCACFDTSLMPPCGMKNPSCELQSPPSTTCRSFLHTKIQPRQHNKKIESRHEDLMDFWKLWHELAVWVYVTSLLFDQWTKLCLHRNRWFCAWCQWCQGIRRAGDI